MMLPVEIIEKRILISVLNWGMGHVSRSIGLIHQLIQQGNIIHIACSKNQKKVYQEYFDTVTFIHHDDYPFEFGGKGNFGWDLFKGYFKLKNRMKKERKEVETMVNNYSIELVLSDHRYGFYSPMVQSFFITHQYNLPVPWYQRNADRLHKKLISKFDSIWIMDDSDSRLAGKLSVSGNERKVNYIGPYSRFMLYDINEFEKNNVTVLVASGPTVYAQQLVDEVLSSTKEKTLVVICEEGILVPIDFQKVVGSWRAQDEILLSAQKIISRSGYSTIMDVDILKCEAEFIPTTGQAEQIYLANY